MFLSILMKVVSFLPSLILGAENLFGSKSGNEKRGSVMSMVLSALGFAESITGKDIVDEAGFREGLESAVNGIVKMLNASIWHKKK